MTTFCPPSATGLRGTSRPLLNCHTPLLSPHIPESPDPRWLKGALASPSSAHSSATELCSPPLPPLGPLGPFFLSTEISGYWDASACLWSLEAPPYPAPRHTHTLPWPWSAAERGGQLWHLPLLSRASKGGGGSRTAARKLSRNMRSPRPAVLRQDAPMALGFLNLGRHGL